jgi:hypothetical protein
MADTNDEAQVYILRNYNSNLASSGFECVMIVGNHYNGTSIEAGNSDIKWGPGVVTVFRGGMASVSVSENVTYTFNTEGNSMDGSGYRLMLIEGKEEDSSEKALEDIAKYLKSINETLAEYVSGVDKRLKKLEEDSKSMESAIEGLDGRVTALEEKEDE